MEQLRQAGRTASADRATADSQRAGDGGARSWVGSVVRATNTIALLFGVAAIAALTGLRWIDAPTPPWVPPLQAAAPVGLPAVLVLCAAAVVLRRRPIAIAAGVLLAVHIWLVAPWWIAGDQVAAGGTGPTDLTVMSSNQRIGWADLEAMADDIRERDVDVLVLVEATTDTADTVRDAGIDRLLPHHIGRAGPGAAGGLVYSRYPLTTDGVPPLPDLRYELPAAVVRAPGGDVLVTGVHTVSPVPRDTQVWHSELAALAVWVDQVPRSQPLVLAGDFNATVDHPVFRRLGDAGMHDAQREIGRGRRRTWPQLRDGIPAVVDLDHVMLRGLLVAEFERIRMPDSDHYAVAASLRTPGM